MRYYLKRRDGEFEQKMAEVLCVYRQVQVLKKAAARSDKSAKLVAIVCYDEKPGIRPIATTASDLPPVPGIHTTFARDFEYKRHGTLSLLAGIDLLTGKVQALVKDRHSSREIIEFLNLLDVAYPTGTATRLILDNHSARISKETKASLDKQPAGGSILGGIAGPVPSEDQQQPDCHPQTGRTTIARHASRLALPIRVRTRREAAYQAMTRSTERQVSSIASSRSAVQTETPARHLILIGTSCFRHRVAGEGGRSIISLGPMP
jgi:hypothetical protein